MKKIVLFLSAIALSAGIASAQDLAKAGEKAQAAIEALNNGDFAGAISGFEAAIAEASESVDEGATELVNNCKMGVLRAMNSQAGAAIEAGNMTEALAKLDEVVAKAKEFEDEEAAQKAADKKLQVMQAAANAEIKAAAAEKDPAAKKAHFEQALAMLDNVLAVKSDNSKVLMQKGQVLNALGKTQDAIATYTAAKEAGAADADKQLSNIYVKVAQASLKAQKYAEAIEAALKSAEFKPNANAYKIAGIAAQKAGKIKDAVEYFGKYLQINPNDEQIKAAVEGLKAQIK